MKQSPEDKAAGAADELRTLIRQAHEAAQALTQAARAARAQVDGYLHDQVQAAMDDYTRQMQAAVDEWGADARADAQRVMRNLNAAMNDVCSIVVDGLKEPGHPVNARAEIVIDLRGQVPVMAPSDSEQGRAILADARYQVIVGPASGPPGPGAGPGGGVS